MPREHIGKMILDASHGFKQELNALFYADNINGLQMRIMGFIMMRGKEGPVYQRDIEAEFKIRRSSVSSVLNTMEKNGLITRHSVEKDARLKELVLTAKAVGIVKNHYEKLTDLEKRLVQGFTDSEKQTLQNLLERVMENIESIKRC